MAPINIELRSGRFQDLVASPAASAMLSVIISACSLVAVTFAVHAVGIAVLVRALMRSPDLSHMRVWRITRMLLRMICWLILIHLGEIALWGSFYLWRECMPDAESAFYFSGVTYTTLGYGHLVLEKPWRTLAPIESLTGILMCGLSTGYLVAVVSHIYRTRHALSAER